MSSESVAKKPYGYTRGDMKPHVEDFSKPAACYSQMYDQAPLNYISRQNYTQKHSATKLKGEAHQGRYDK